MRHRALPERDRAPPGRVEERVTAVIREPAADARAHDGAGGVAVAADRAVVPDRHVVEGQARRRAGCVSRRREDPPAGGRTHELEVTAAPPVTAPPAGLVVLEEAAG